MGGFGSGGHNKRRAHLEGYRRISVGYLRRHRLLRLGARSTLSWTNGFGERTGSISVIGGETFVTLSYSVRRDETEAWRQVEDRVALTRVPKPFGGEQLYFRCPRCCRRVMELALGSGGFRCRTCLGLVHASSQESPTDRAMRRASKLKQKLGAEPGIDSLYRRPRHMRRATFEKIDARIQAAEAEVNDAHVRLLARLGRLDLGRSKQRMHGQGRRAAGRSFW